MIKQVWAYKEPWMQENGRNIFRTVVSKVSSFVGNPVFFHDKRLSDLYVVKPEKLTVYFLNENFCAPEKECLLKWCIFKYSWIFIRLLDGLRSAEDCHGCPNLNLILKLILNLSLNLSQNLQLLKVVFIQVNKWIPEKKNIFWYTSVSKVSFPIKTENPKLLKLSL